MHPDDKQDVARELPQHLDALWRFALRLTSHRDDAADLVQKTCVRALEQRGTYREQGRLKSWLFRIQHTTWLNELRMRASRPQLAAGTDVERVIDLVPRTDAGEPTEPESTLYFRQVCEAVDALPDGQREVMELVCIEGMSYQETAEILDIAPGTVMSRLARARVAVGQRMIRGAGDAPHTPSRTASSPKR